MSEISVSNCFECENKDLPLEGFVKKALRCDEAGNAYWATVTEIGESVLPEGAATEATLLTLATEATVALIKPLEAISSVELTRPADTNIYAVSDAVSDSTSSPTLLAVAGCARGAGGKGRLMSIKCMTDNAAWAGAQMRIHVYSDTITAVNDNAQMPMLYANKAKRVGYFDIVFGTEGTGSDACIATMDVPDRLYACTATSLYLLPEMKTASTPTSGQKFYFTLSMILE